MYEPDRRVNSNPSYLYFICLQLVSFGSVRRMKYETDNIGNTIILYVIM